MASTVEEKEELKKLFNSWIEIKDSRKELPAENKLILEDAARILDCKSAVVTKLFNFKEKKMEDGEDDLAELNELNDRYFE